MERLEYADKFNIVLNENDKVLWTGAVNQKAYVKNNLRTLFFIGFFPLALPFVLLAFTLFLPLTLYVVRRKARNTFVCITETQVILRAGYFRANYQHFPIQSCAEINIKHSVFDSEEPEYSATLVLNSRYHAGEQAIRLNVQNLANANEAYKIIQSLREMK